MMAIRIKIANSRMEFKGTRLRDAGATEKNFGLANRTVSQETAAVLINGDGDKGVANKHGKTNMKIFCKSCVDFHGKNPKHSLKKK